MTSISDKLQSGVNFLYRFLPQRKPSPEQLQKTKLVAHRGAWKTTDHLENTISAFSACLDKSVWAIEFDLRWTLDNVPVIHHDPTLDRIFKDSRSIENFNFIDLRAEFPLIPTFDEVIEQFHNSLHLMIEIKEVLTPSQAQILKHCLADLTPTVDYHLMSLQIEILLSVGDFPKECLVSIGRTDIQKIFDKTLEHSLGGVTGHYLLLSNKMLGQCQQQKIKTGTGFPDSRNSLYREINRGTDWIFTNHPIELSRLLKPL